VISAASFRDPRAIPAAAHAEMHHWGVTQHPTSEEARRRSVLAIGTARDCPVLAAPPEVPTVSDDLSPEDRKFRQTFGWESDADFPVMRKSSA
jgi:hypothetical protein